MKKPKFLKQLSKELKQATDKRDIDELNYLIEVLLREVN